MVLSDVAATAARARALTAGDVGAALALSSAAGWNQTATDWLFFIDQGRALACADEAGRLVATAAALPYEGDVGWISMVLVTPPFRHRGVATRLLDRSIEALEAAGLAAALDATPAGAAVYAKRGFVAGFRFDRWERTNSGMTTVRSRERGDAHQACRVVAGAADIATCLALDAAATGLGRAALLGALLGRPDTRAWLAPDGDGFVLARAGQRAVQIGPLVAASDADAMRLLAAALVGSDGHVFIDVPEGASAMTERLVAAGFSVQRSFVRMALVRADVLARSHRLHALCGPEFG